MLWTAVRTIQKENPEVISVIYSGDTDVTPAVILENVHVCLLHSFLIPASLQHYPRSQDNPYCPPV